MQYFQQIATPGANNGGWARATEVLLTKTHVLNRRLCAVKILLSLTREASGGWQSTTGDDLGAAEANSRAFLCAECAAGVTLDCTHLAAACRVLGVNNLSQISSSVVAAYLQWCGETQAAVKWLHVRKLLPKNGDLSAEYDCVVSGVNWLLFFTLSECSHLSPAFPFALHFGSAFVRVAAPLSSHASSSAGWLEKHVLPRLARWTVDMSSQSGPVQEEEEDVGQQSVHSDKCALADNSVVSAAGSGVVQSHADTDSGSLRLVDVEDYYTLYHELKARYGPYFVQIWPEKTDPLKFVYEDVAIAAYLILIWRQTPLRQQFVDLGCGNGLLVHILSSEGYPGYGVDVRSRKIWQLYPSSTKLQVRGVVPSVERPEFTDCDWLLGNHSDELTVWLPVLAAAISANSDVTINAASDVNNDVTTNATSDVNNDVCEDSRPGCCFFVLPCCPWSFYTKFSHFSGLSGAFASRYDAFVAFVAHVSNGCGFVTEHDRLRIPSTRRRCLLGRSGRLLDPLRLRALVASYAQATGGCSSSSENGRFNIRPAIEPVRNCTRLPAAPVAALVRQMALMLAAEPPPGQMALASLAQRLAAQSMLDCGGENNEQQQQQQQKSSPMRLLRRQCGGLQTLLRNNRHIFAVRAGVVSLQTADWLSVSSQVDTGAMKTRLCWLHDHLPTGCPVAAELCRFAHGADDLRLRSPPQEDSTCQR